MSTRHACCISLLQHVSYYVHTICLCFDMLSLHYPFYHVYMYVFRKTHFLHYYYPDACISMQENVKVSDGKPAAKSEINLYWSSSDKTVSTKGDRLIMSLANKILVYIWYVAHRQPKTVSNTKLSVSTCSSNVFILNHATFHIHCKLDFPHSRNCQL